MADIDGHTRAHVESWLKNHTGDFQKIIDFTAVIGEVKISWEKKDSEVKFQNCNPEL